MGQSLLLVTGRRGFSESGDNTNMEVSLWCFCSTSNEFKKRFEWMFSMFIGKLGQSETQSHSFLQFNSHINHVKEVKFLWTQAYLWCWFLALSMVLKSFLQQRQDEWRWSEAPHVSIYRQANLHDCDSLRLCIHLFKGTRIKLREC